MQLTKPLKSWKDDQGHNLYRLGDLPSGTAFKQQDSEVVYETINYPRSTRTGKRQCVNKETGKVEYLSCSKKVIVSE